MTIPNPTQLARSPDESALEITWSDGTLRKYLVRELRDRCPCATCREKRQFTPAPGQLTVLQPGELQPLRISSMTPVGNYAYAITFSDGHDTGIYSLESLWHWQDA